MLNDCIVYPTIGVKNIDQAKEFYENTLGFSDGQQNPGGIFYPSGQSGIFVYTTSYAGTNQATYATWEVDDVEEMVANLKNKGVTFEHYEDMPGTTLEGDVHIMGEMKAAWFKDPDGNILNIVNKVG